MSSCESPSRWGVILLAHGAPDRLEDIPAFLLALRNGRPLPPAAVEEIVGRYRLVSSLPGAAPGEASPLTRLTFRQAAALKERLRSPVYVGMRNWRPYIVQAIKEAAADRIEQLIAVCLAPQNSRTSVGQYRQALEEARQKVAPGLSVEFVASWHDYPGLIAAFRDRLASAIASADAAAGAPVPVIFTAHSVPERTIRDGDPYQEQVGETARLVAESLHLEPGRWSVAFQSQGMTPEPWIGPTVESEIDRLAAAGHRHVVVAPVGFVCDHVEILYDIDVVFREHGNSKGIALSRPESLNDSPIFIEALATLASERMAVGDS
jgi:ferrochelatase